MGPRTEGIAAASALAVQGPLLAYLSRQSAEGYAAFSIASVALGLALGALMARARRGAARAAALPLSLGMLAMLAGLYMDAGFAPLVGKGVCLCGCADSLTGAGLFGRFRWTQALMAAACAASALGSRRQAEPVGARTVLSSLLMLAGMGAAGAAAGRLRVEDPVLALVASYLAMSAGMAAGWDCARRVPLVLADIPILSPWRRRSNARAL